MCLTISMSPGFIFGILRYEFTTPVADVHKKALNAFSFCIVFSLPSSKLMIKMKVRLKDCVNYVRLGNGLGNLEQPIPFQYRKTSTKHPLG